MKLAAAATGAGELPEPRLSGLAHNPVCGDKVTITMRLDGRGRIMAFAHETKACVFTQASAAILGEHLLGADEQRVRRLRNEVEAMLVGNGAPGAPFADYAALAGVAVHKNRHTCVLLPIDAIIGALSVAEPLEIANPGAKRSQRKRGPDRPRSARGKKRIARTRKPRIGKPRRRRR